MFSFIQEYVQDSETAEKLESGVQIIINDRTLIPNADLSDVDKKRTKFNARRKALSKRAFGSE